MNVIVEDEEEDEEEDDQNSGYNDNIDFSDSFADSIDNIESFTDDELEALLAVLIEDLPQTFFNYTGSQKKKRQKRQRVDLWGSEWGRLLKHHKTSTPGTFEYIKFRLRFRVPFPLFKLRLIPAIKKAKLFNPVRDSYIPLEFKVMVALRMIGRDTDADTASELSGIPKSTCNSILKHFCIGFVEAFYKDFVYFPEGDDLANVMDVFAKVGFPGAMGSMDVTHFRWLACPKDNYNFCKGKYPFPTLASQAVVDHNRRILFLSSLYDGRENDKNITSDDDFTYRIMMGKFDDIEYKLYDDSGTLRICKGGYLLVDGGYHNISCFVDPVHHANGLKEVHWSEFLESVRKDVECTFGILKQRFRILRNGLQYDREVSNAIVKTCAILHNMLLVYDGLDEFQWNKNEDWKDDDPDMADEDIIFHQPNNVEENNFVEPVHRFAVVVNDTTPVGTSFRASSRNDYNNIHAALVTHLYHQWRYGQLQWPRRFSNNCKKLHPMTRVKHALANHTYDSLYAKPSDFVYVDVNGNQRLDVNMGSGLFCSMLLPSTKCGIKLAEFKGVRITEAQLRVIDDAGLGGYVIQTRDWVIDCYNNARDGLCMASMANSALRCFNKSLGSTAVNNCKIKVHKNTVSLYTMPNTAIPPNRELSWAYQNGYRYPVLPAVPNNNNN